MFGFVCGGRPVETVVNQVEPAKFVFEVNDAAKINHIALFLLPGAQLPVDAAAAVYAQMPGKQEFTLLGALTASKQSAIFKLNMGSALSLMNDVDEMVDDDSTPASEATIMFGISIEPAAQVEQYVAAQRSAVSSQPKAIAAPAPSPSGSSTEVASLANGIIRNAYNFLASFVDAQGKVPIKAFDDWWNKFKTRISSDPSYVTTLESS